MGETIVDPIDAGLLAYQKHKYEKASISCLSPNAPICTNEKGGRQSYVPYALDCLPPEAILDLGAVLGRGRKKYGKDNGKKICIEDHLNHAMVHILGWLSGDRQDNHLGHVLCRAVMAHQLSIEEGGMTEEKAEGLVIA